MAANEELGDKLDRIVADLAEMKEYYELGEKLYPYSQLREGKPSVRFSFEVNHVQMNENTLRQQQADALDYEAPATGNLLFPLLFSIVLSRFKTGGFAPKVLMSQPKFSLAYFLFGYGISKAPSPFHIRREHHIKLRQAENERAHAIFQTLDFHLTTRKMDVFEMNVR